MGAARECRTLGTGRRGGKKQLRTKKDAGSTEEGWSYGEMGRGRGRDVRLGEGRGRELGKKQMNHSGSNREEGPKISLRTFLTRRETGVKHKNALSEGGNAGRR